MLVREIHIWLADKVNIKLDQIDSIHLNTAEYCIYLKFSSLGTDERCLRDTPEELPFFIHKDGTQSMVKIVSASDDITLIRILDLSIQENMAVVRAALSKYGHVKEH